MSRIPTLSNELSPRSLRQIGEMPSNATATAIGQQIISPRLSRGSSQRSVMNKSSIKSRKRASTDTSRVPAMPKVRERSSSFASSQELKGFDNSSPAQQLGRRISERNVQAHLKLRQLKLKEAESRGDEVEFLRLKNLRLFDDIDRPTDIKAGPKLIEPEEKFTGRTDHHQVTSQVDFEDSSSIPRPKSVNQGHTATLCWHLKLEHIQGRRVPEEFSQCDFHPTPSPCASSSPSFESQPMSPSSLGSKSRRSLRRTKVLPSKPSALRESPESSLITRPSTAIASEPLSPTKHALVSPGPDEEDPFLYIAKYIINHTKGNQPLRKAKPSRVQPSVAKNRRSFRIECTCTNHTCGTYLSGPPSKHCRFCKLPKLRPEIAAAVDRIEEIKTSILAQADANIPATEHAEADEFRMSEALQEDTKLVEMYNLEMEKRIKNGVWWEGWLVVAELRKRGIVGSKALSI